MKHSPETREDTEKYPKKISQTIRMRPVEPCESEATLHILNG